MGVSCHALSKMAVFVTVGTTKFDELIRAVVAEDFQKVGSNIIEHIFMIVTLVASRM